MGDRFLLPFSRSALREHLDHFIATLPVGKDARVTEQYADLVEIVTLLVHFHSDVVPKIVRLQLREADPLP